jgi:Ca2+-binding RTX toxin-like protein
MHSIRLTILGRSGGVAVLGAAVTVLAMALTAPAHAAGRCDLGGRGSDALDGGAGKDCLGGGRGADFISGGRGADTIRGGRGPDQLLAGPGLDRVSAGPGNDLISAQDGQAETIYCGSGNDLASADASDVPIDCETVHLNAAQEEWFQFYTWINAYGKAKFGGGGWGFCKRSFPDSNNCTGRAEEGYPSPFGSGGMTMDWTLEANGTHDLTIKSTEKAATIHGLSNRDWSAVTIDYARVPAWADPQNSVIRTGSGEGGRPGPLQAYLGFHDGHVVNYDGYHLSLKGWLRIIRF